MTKFSHKVARQLLVQERGPGTMSYRKIIEGSADMVHYRADRVPLYYDRGNKVASACGKIAAYRAVTLRGQFLWLVFHEDKALGYHALCLDAGKAIAMAQDAWARCRAVRQEWDTVERTARDLIWGRQRFDVRIEDLWASPLCHLGFEGFRRAIGMGRVSRISGRAAALLMKIEPQMGFVIHAAMQRHAAAGQMTEAQAQGAMA